MRRLWNNAVIRPFLLAIMPALKLSDLSAGNLATIVSIHAEEALHQRLLALGFRSGKNLEIIRKAPFSGRSKCALARPTLCCVVAKPQKLRCV